MNKKVRLLLGLDAIINLVLGSILLLYPLGLPSALGLPEPGSYFYSSILGGVIFGIGLALGLEWWRGESILRGLGLAGAIAINLCGGGVLLYWLITDALGIPLRGTITLSIVAFLVLGIGLVELVSGAWKSN